MIKITLFLSILLFVLAVTSFSLVTARKQMIENNLLRNPQKFATSSRKHHLKNPAENPEQICMGEFQMCPKTFECTLIPSRCGTSPCAPGEYICPFVDKDDPRNNCATKFSQCPGLNSTFWDWTLPLDTRLELLAKAVSIDDQAAQLTNSAPEIESQYISAYQWLNDDLHGVRRNWTTSFPDGVGLGATWDADLIGYGVAQTISREAREIHHFYTSRGFRGVNGILGGESANGLGMSIYAPNINLAAKPRWGRNQEVYGEDPVHMKKIAAEYVKGMQTTFYSPQTNAYYYQGIACGKHFLAYDTESFPTPRYQYNAIVDGRNLFESYLPSFRYLVEEAEVQSIMDSYNLVNGIPTVADRTYLIDFLRTKWNFKGFVVSDYDACTELVYPKEVVNNLTAAAALAYGNGLDQEGGGTGCSSHIPDAIKAGMLNPSVVTTSFKRLFRARILLGMLDPPDLLPAEIVNPQSKEIGDDSDEALSLEAALESATLFANKNGNSIPAEVTEGSTGKTLIVGPKAASTKWVLGNYAVKPRAGTISALEGIVNFLCPYDNAFGMNYSYGVSIFAFPDWEQTYPPQKGVPSLEDCRSMCENSLQCNFFSYITKDKECFLLPIQGTPVQNPDVISGARHGLVIATPGVTYAQNSAVLPIVADDVRECSQRCRVETSCSHFTFDSEFSLCWLLPASQTKTEISSSEIFSGPSPVKCSTVEYVEMCADSDISCKNPSTVNKAVTLAKNATQTIVIFGLDQTLESEGHDRHTIDLPSEWYSILPSLSENAKKLYGIMIHGGSFRVDRLLFDGLLDFWYPGQQGGRAIAQVLFGQYAPAGRTAVTWYQSDSDLPVNLAYQNFYPNKDVPYGVSYRYFTKTPLIPFGFGLTLPTFDYSDLIVSPTQAIGCQVINVSFIVTAREGTPFAGFSDEVAQVYIKQLNSSVPAPQVRLVNFTRLHQVPIAGGGAGAGGARVFLQIDPRDRMVVMQNDAVPHLSKEIIEDGELEVFVGGGQPGYFLGGLSQKVQVFGGGASC